MAELCFSVDDLILDFFSKTAADTASEYESYGHRRCCPAATVPVAVVFACGVCYCIAEEIENKIIDRKTELRHHRLPSKGHSNEYENNTRKSLKDGFLGVWFWRRFRVGRANRGCQGLASGREDFSPNVFGGDRELALLRRALSRQDCHG